MGLLPPRYQYVPSGNFFIFRSGENRKAPGDGDPPQFITQQNPAGKPRFQGRFRDFSAGPLLTPWSSPNRRFLVPMMAVSPLNRTLI